ncbi:hypothetical protein H8356DRAFT_1084310 [Neocallimastix lanati (nom. inval.)]|nr:hypothetical protein H8356DRAFT_1084310 [Neocallimastix sp. JGI-2020a]
MALIDKNDKKVTAPKKPLIAINQRFVHDKEITLLLKEKILSFSNEDYIVKDVEGESYFKCKGKAFSIRDKKFLHDLDNNPILTIQNKIFSLKGQMTLYDGNDSSKVLGKITPNSLLVKKKLTVQFHNKTTGDIENKRKTIITLMKLIKELINNINMFYDLYIDLPLRYFELINDTIFKEINLSELVYRIKAYEDKNVINYLFISNILETVTNNNIES